MLSERVSESDGTLLNLRWEAGVGFVLWSIQPGGRRVDLPLDTKAMDAIAAAWPRFRDEVQSETHE